MTNEEIGIKIESYKRTGQIRTAEQSHYWTRMFAINPAAAELALSGRKPGNRSDAGELSAEEERILSRFDGIIDRSQFITQREADREQTRRNRTVN